MIQYAVPVTTEPRVPTNTDVQVNGGDLMLSALDMLEEPASWVALKAAVARLTG